MHAATLLPHAIRPAGQVQSPPWQVLPSSHCRQSSPTQELTLRPHAPQCSALLWVSTQANSGSGPPVTWHEVWRCGHRRHLPFTQVWPSSHWCQIRPERGRSSRESSTRRSGSGRPAGPRTMNCNRSSPAGRSTPSARRGRYTPPPYSRWSPRGTNVSTLLLPSRGGLTRRLQAPQLTGSERMSIHPARPSKDVHCRVPAGQSTHLPSRHSVVSEHCCQR